MQHPHTMTDASGQSSVPVIGNISRAVGVIRPVFEGYSSQSPARSKEALSTNRRYVCFAGLSCFSFCR